MPSYTFHCRHCGTFTLWYKSMAGNLSEASCPDCGTEANRVFTPPITFRMDGNVKKRIERGMEPRVVKREELPARPAKRQSPSRPWQAGH